MIMPSLTLISTCIIEDRILSTFQKTANGFVTKVILKLVEIFYWKIVHFVIIYCDNYYLTGSIKLKRLILIMGCRYHEVFVSNKNCSSSVAMVIRKYTHVDYIKKYKKRDAKLNDITFLS